LHPVALLGEAHEAVGRKHCLPPQPLADRGEEHTLQTASTDCDLRLQLARGPPPRFPPDSLAEAVEQRPFLDRIARSRHLLGELNAGELGHGLRLDVDADAELAQLGSCIEKPDRETPRVQEQRGGKAADSGSGDHHLHARIAPLCASAAGGALDPAVILCDVLGHAAPRTRGAPRRIDRRLVAP
jgi:hypothetical protein